MTEKPTHPTISKYKENVFKNNKGERYIVSYQKFDIWNVLEEKTGKEEQMSSYQLIEFNKLFKLRKAKQ
ncbi:hypothetical protein H7198_01775 [Fructobacillus sp. CRL 2054]|uniref:hypothetical protein n=1 Tax=Fructobacillus sp. CRL 2054 TaxID=2763007 RepID=UPI002378703F|nr:hypothetical protein [Fructobacillus sp. CRL 2054]MDD9138342.1 hypothetical protein [Fructobacillus sp. CRL 2054]